MSEGVEQDKSELPSQSKLDKARREGSVARGMDLGFVSILAALTGFAWFAGRGVFEVFARSAEAGLAAAGADLAGREGLMVLAGRLGSPMAAALLPMLVCVFVLVLVLEFIQTGPVFSFSALRIDFSRLIRPRA